MGKREQAFTVVLYLAVVLQGNQPQQIHKSKHPEA